MYCTEQIVIPDRISNLLKTYAKAALKTQPYDLLRWSAAYFRCLSMDILPPVKPRYEQENMFGCLTKGYLKVLLSQVGKGYFIRRDVLDHRWNGLCLPEDELHKFLSLTRMLYWPQVHWLKLMAVMVGSINPNFKASIIMLCELLTDDIEGGCAPIPLWLFVECFKYLAELDCSSEQTFLDGKKVLFNGVLENGMEMPESPKKFSSHFFKSAIIDYWRFHIEINEKEKLQCEIDESNADNAASSNIKLKKILQSPMKSGSNFRIVGQLKDPNEIVKRSQEFYRVIDVLQQLKCDGTFEPETYASAQILEEGSQNYFDQGYCNMLKVIGPPWNWLFIFASHNSHESSFNFLEHNSTQSDDDFNCSDDNESFDYLNEKCISRKSSGASSTTRKDKRSFEVVVDAETVERSTNKQASMMKILVDSICSISDASERGECKIKETSSIANFFNEQYSKKELKTVDYERLKCFIGNAQQRGIVFNDINELYNYFIQEASKEFQTLNIRNEDDEASDETYKNNILSSTISKRPESSEKDENDSKNVVSIFGESGIEVDNKLLDAKVSEKMILGLVDRPKFEENFIDIPSSNASVSSISHAETVKLNHNNVTREKVTQTVLNQDQIHQKQIDRNEKSKSSATSSIKCQPITCKIPLLPGIGPSMDAEQLGKVLRFITHRSIQQGGFVYPRNLMEDETCVDI